MKFIVLFIALCAITSGLHSQNNRYTPLSVNTAKTNSVPETITSLVSDAVIMDADNTIINSIVSKKDENIVLNIPFRNQQSLNINLKKFDVLTPDAKTVAGTDKGDVEIGMKNKIVSYTGQIPGDRNSCVSVTFGDDYMMGMVMSENETYVLGKLDKGYILYQASKMKITQNFKCGSDAFEIPQEITKIQRSVSGNIKDYSTSDIVNVKIALESDYETFQRYGSVQAAETYILSLFATVSALYVRELNIKLISPYLRVWSTSADPYSGASSNDFLVAFRSYWNANMQSVQRTIAHYITTRSGNMGGIAYVNTLCASLSSGYGYAFSNIDGTFNSLPTYSWDVMVVAHESGHNFGSPHTHSCTWPGGAIDSCYATEGGCYTGPVIPRLGTIMSYCHLTSGGIALHFGPLPGNLIRTDAENAPCITTSTGILVSLPNGREVYRSGNTPVIIWGTSVSGNVNIDYTTDNGSNWINIQNNVQASLRNYTWTVPYISTTTQAKVKVYESSNPGNNDVSDSAFQIRPSINIYSLTSPVQLSRFYVNSGDTTKLNFNWSRSGSLPEFKYKWVLSTLNNSFVYSRSSNNSGSDSVCSISYGQLDSIMSSWNVQSGDSLRVRWNVKTNTMFDSANASTNYLITFVRGPVGISPISSEVPQTFYLDQNYPNPFNPNTNIKFGVPGRSAVKISIYDVLGREVSVLLNESLNPGTYNVNFDASNYPSGAYFYRMSAIKTNGQEYSNIKTMILLK